MQRPNRSVLRLGSLVFPNDLTMPEDLTITRGFPDALRSEVALLYDAAFGPKLSIAIPNTHRRLKVLEQAFDPHHSFVALSGERVLGIAGFKTQSGAFTSGIGPALLRRHLGLLGSLRAVLVLALFERKLSPNELLMDGIAVSPSARGGGVGTTLLERLKQFSADDGYQTIRLDVINTNINARRLYERLGFVPTKTSHFGYLRWLLGFSGATTLQYRVKPTA